MVFTLKSMTQLYNFVHFFKACFLAVSNKVQLSVVIQKEIIIIIIITIKYTCCIMRRGLSDD